MRAQIEGNDVGSRDTRSNFERLAGALPRAVAASSVGGMTRKKALSEAGDAELVSELARRNAEKHFREGRTLTEMELSIEAMVHGHREPSIVLMLQRSSETTHLRSAEPDQAKNSVGDRICA